MYYTKKLELQNWSTKMNNYNYVAPCLMGLESVVAGELKRMGANDVTSHNGKVTFTGDTSILARANINLRTAERVLIELASFKATNWDELFDGASTINIEGLIASKDAFPIKGHSLNSKLTSVPTCQSIIKKALVKRMQRHYGLEFLPETGVVHQIQFSLHNDIVTIMLDTSGDGLHKRGYRVNSNSAPIKETLAAGIIDLAHVRNNVTFYDPFCGSGTFIIESAMKALNIPPCLKRAFAAQNFGFIDEQVWADERTRGLDLIKRDANYMGFGSDIDHDSVELTKANAKKAGVFSKIMITQRDINEFTYKSEKGTICTNPPYGERMLELDQANAIYREMGKQFTQLDGASIYVISPSEEFESLYGVKARKRRKLYNGMIKCQLFMYF